MGTIVYPVMTPAGLTLGLGRAFGRVALELYSTQSGLLVARAAWGPNTTTKAGRAKVLEVIQANNASNGLALAKIGVGDGRVAPTVNDTQLGNELVRKAISGFDNSKLVDEPPSWEGQVQLDPLEANSFISEIGLYLNDGSETLYARGLLPPGQGAITGATQADPVVITSNGHGLVDGQIVYLEDVGGMVEVNSDYNSPPDPKTPYTVDNAAANTFELLGVDGTGFTAYTTGGTWTVVVPKTASEVGTAKYEVGLQA